MRGTILPTDPQARAEVIAHHCANPSFRNGEWAACCPAHDDATPSLTVGTKQSKIVLHCQAGCSANEIVQALGLKMSDLFMQPAANGTKRIIKTYPYVDAHGTIIHETVRCEPKEFRQRHPDSANPGEYIWNLKGIEPVLYHLPQVLEVVQQRETIYVVEGEKDAAALEALGVVATCNPMGVGKWRDSYSAALHGADVVILPDYDEPSWKHAALVAKKLAAVAQRVRIVSTIHTDTPGSDVADWINTGGTLEDFKAAVAQESEQEPAQLDERIYGPAEPEPVRTS